MKTYMGLNYKDVVKEYIGEITYSNDQNPPQITLPCAISREGNLTFVLCDKKGKSRCEKKVYLNKGKTELVFKLAQLKNGEYNAWIEVNGQTYLRRLQVYSAKETSDIFSRIKKWF